tara:strand:- start:630 stop:911 length:282 start_codon:yes stop_codon:yes gene_type:complete
MPKKPKATKVPSLGDDHALATTHSVFNLPALVAKDSKIQAKDVFDGYKKKTPAKKKTVPKGSHRMPDGSIMKDSAMPKKKTKKKTKTKTKTAY